jgi:nitrate reductase beta subunit
LDAEQLALVPPFEPPQLHVHGPDPATLDDVPAEQRLLEGADDACVPFADPHAPATGAGAALTATVVLAAADKPLYPIQVSV